MTGILALRALRDGVGDVVREGARKPRAPVERYRFDPFRHLEEGHVSILGLAEPDDIDDVVEDDDTGLRLKRMIFTPYQHELEIARAWLDLDALARSRKHPETATLRWQNAILDKSRQMGFTWTTCWLLLWALMYWPETVALAIHLNSGKVDDGGERSTTESIFGRIRYMAESKTSDGGTTWPEAYYPRDLLDFKQTPISSITNRFSGARLIGAVANEDPGRGGTYTNILVDEFAAVPWGDSVHRSIRSACPRGRLYASTPRGKSNRFYRLVERVPKGYERLQLHWTRHPTYGAGAHLAAKLDPKTHLLETPGDVNCDLCEGTRLGLIWSPENPQAHRYPGRMTSPWYEAAIMDLDDVDVAQEIDISYEGSLTARVYPEFDVSLHVLPHIPFDEYRSVEFSFDYGWSPSSTHVGIWQDFPDSLRKIGEVEVTEATPDEVATLIRNELADLGMKLLGTEPRFTRQYLAIGDPSGAQPSLLSGRTLVDEYALQGFTIIPAPGGAGSIRQSIRSYKRLLRGIPKPVRYSAHGCPKTIRHLEENRWPTDRYGKLKEDSPEPFNDEHNHSCFVAGTLVTTKRGDVPIERVRVGDYALTREGWRSVLVSRATGLREVITIEAGGRTLTGTADHPLWVDGVGWVPMGAVNYSSCLLLDRRFAQPTRAQGGRGYRRTGRSRQGTTFTIETAIRSITTRRILSVFRMATTCAYTALGDLFPRASWLTFREPDRYSNLDTDGGRSRKTGREHSRTLVEPRWLLGRLSSWSARSAGALTGRWLAGTLASVLRPAVLPLGEPLALTTYVGSVRRAGLSSRSTATQVANAAPGLAPGSSGAARRRARVTCAGPRLWLSAAKRRSAALEPVALSCAPRPAGTQRVFNLTVDEEHEYLANGFLVSNCRADSYYITWKYPAPTIDETLAAVATAAEPAGPYTRVESYDDLPRSERGDSIDPGLGPNMRF